MSRRSVRLVVSFALLMLGARLGQATPLLTLAGDSFDTQQNLIRFQTSVADFNSQTTRQDMFGVRSRSVLPGSVLGLPQTISDDSIEGAAGNSRVPNDTQGVVGVNKTDAFFGVADVQNGLNPTGQASATWTFDISGATSVDQISLDIGAMGNFEATGVATPDRYRFLVSIDGSAPMEILEFLADEAISQTYRPLDNGVVTTLDDPLVETTRGTVLNKAGTGTGLLDTFLVDLAPLGLSSTGTELTLIFEAQGDGNDEALVFDNIEILGIPEPSTLLLAGLGVAGFSGILIRRRHSSN